MTNETNRAKSSLADSIASDMLTKIQNGDNIAPTQILQTAMDLIMLAERNLHLQKSCNDKANGFFERELGTALGPINIKVPRDRNGDFRPAVLPNPYQRDVEGRENIIQSLLVNGYSPNAIQRSLNELNLHYNPKELEQIKDDYFELFQQWQNRQLPQDVIAIFIDVYHCEACINNKVRKVALYVIVGINFNGQKDLFGLYLYEGNENKAFWLQTLNQLIERGLKRPLIVISDDFPSLKESVATLFPNALHQLCFIHMQRNVRRNMGVEDSKNFNQALKQIKFIDDFETCINEFKELCQKNQKKYPAFIAGLINDAENYFAFKYLHSDAQKHFYTTNIVESVNSILERLRMRMGGFFQSQEALFANVFININSLQKRKWLNGVPKIKGNLYQLRQLFAQNYGELPKVN
jgi:putative transposase